MFRKITLSLTFAVLTVFMTTSAVFAAPPADWPEVVRFGLIPTEGGASITERFQVLREHLEKELGVPVKMISASDYAGTITAMANKHLEFAYFGPKSYVEASRRSNAQALLMELGRDGSPGYYGIVITRKDSGITSMKKAKGKTFAFTDPNSTSGYLVPNVLFARDMKVAPEKYFKKVMFSGSHGASMLAVKNGAVQVAATNDLDLGRLIQRGDLKRSEFNYLWKSDLIPGAPVAARKDIPQSLKAAFIKAMLKFNKDKAGLERLQNGGYVKTTDKAYDIIRYMSSLKKKLAK